MSLEEWLKKNGHTKCWFASKVGVSRVHLYRICKKKHRPNIATSRLIAILTNNEVTEKDLRGE